MPRGVPNAGFRKTQAWSDRTGEPKIDYSAPKPVLVSVPRVAPIPVASYSSSAAMKLAESFLPDTDDPEESILERINSKFKILGELVVDATQGDPLSIFVSGPAGCGKSHLVEEKLKEWNPDGDEYTIVKGTVRPTGLFTTLYDYRAPGSIIVFDDADSIFEDEQCLNFLKAVCDTGSSRTVSYLSKVDLFSDRWEEDIPKTFTFEGTIIFITNYDFDEMVNKSTKLSPHMKALQSRAYYLDLTMKTRRDCFIRIKDVVNNGMLAGLTVQQRNEVLDFIYEKRDIMRELSLRSALKIGGLRKRKPDSWKEYALNTCCRRG